MTGAGRPALDAVVVGAGPNGLAAAITLARAGRSVLVVEGAPTIGGGMRTMELTLPGFRHDVCSTIVPLLLASPFFRTVDWAAHGVELVEPKAPLAHPFDDGRAVVLERSFTATAASLDADRRTDDGSAWRRLFGPLARDAEVLARELLRPVVHVPRHPLALARFGLPALRSATGLARGRFDGEAARALFGGIAAHSMLALDRPLTASFGLVLGTYAHAVGWPMVRGGTAAVAEALAARAAGARRRDRHGPPGPRPRRPAAGPGRAARHDAARGSRHRRRPAAATHPAPLRAVPLRPGRLQGRLGARRPGAVARRGRAPGGHGPPRRDARRDRPLRAPGRGRPSPGSAVHAVRPVRPVGSVTRSGRRPAGRDHGLGVLPRAGGVGRRHDRPHRGPGRAVRAGVPGSHPGAGDAWAGRDGGARPELRRAATSTAASRTSASCSSGRRSRATRTTRARACTCARRRPRRAAASTAWAVTSPRARPSGATCARSPGRPRRRPRGAATSRTRARRPTGGRSRPAGRARARSAAPGRRPGRPGRRRCAGRPRPARAAG